MAFVYAEQATWSGKRFLALLGAIGVNLGLILALSNGLTFDKVVVWDPAPPPVQIIKDPPQKRVMVVPTVPQGALQPTVPEVYMPVPVIPIEFDPAAPGAGPVPQEPVVPAIVPSTPLQAAGALTPPVYPAISIKLEEQGTVQLMIYVLPNGQVGDVRIARSSGFPRLDQAAMAAARRGWRFKPATSGGGPMAAWGRYAVTFSLKD